MERARFKHDIANVYSYGNKIKIIYLSTPRRISGDEGERSTGNSGRAAADGERLDNNICRAKARVQELALCNPWQYFVTLTLDAVKYDRYNLSGFVSDLTQWVRNQRRLKGVNIQYLLIPEQHQDGAWHLHGLMAGLSGEMVRRFGPDEHLPLRLLRQIRDGVELCELPGLTKKFGWTTASPVRDAERCASYITKYISKQAEATAAVLDAGKHLYYASRGLQGRKLLYSGPIADAGSIPWGFENEYCKILWTDADGLNGLQVDPVFRRG